MKSPSPFRSTLTAALIAGGSLLAAESSQAQTVIDTFSDTDLSNYTRYKVLEQGTGTSNISFSSPSGSLVASSSGTTGAEQVLFFNNEGFTLEQGFELQADGPIFDSGANTFDFGLAIGATPTGLGEVPGDERAKADFLFVSFRDPTQLNPRGFINGTELTQMLTSGVTASTVFLARLLNDDVQMGYYNANNARVVLRTVTPVNNNIFNNVGFYTDLRQDGATMSGLDNLRIIPEPSTFTLLLGGVGLFAGMRRRRR